MTRRALISVVAAVAAAAVGGFVVIDGLATASPSEETTQADRSPAEEDDVEAPVSADLLWDETFEAVECLRDEGFDVFGPVPVTSGAGIMYSIASTAETREAEDRCAEDLEPLTRRFFFANAPQDGPDGEPTPPTAEAERLEAIAGQLESCLVDAGMTLDESDADLDPDVPLTRAAQDHPSAYDQCARQV